MKRFLSLLILVASVSFAAAQNPVSTNPSTRNAVSTASATVTVTNTFQSVYAVNANRFGCVIQNKGSHNMYVNFVSLATATISNSALVAPGSSANCTLSGTVLTGQISVTGTAGDDFYASQY